jgi:predicted deacylase
VLLIGSQHGHELLGDYLWEYVKKKRPELLSSLSYICANPQAHHAKKRFIESDMNRSYNGKTNTIEERLAGELLADVQAGDYDFVLDLHTTTVPQPPIIITANLKEAKAFIEASAIDKIIVMPMSIAGVAFIGRYPKSVSIEVNADDAKDPVVLGELCDDIARYLDGTDANAERQYYQVTGYLRGSDVTPAEAATMKNFIKFRNQFYPVLVGEQSYDPSKYLGFKAKKL